MPLTLTDSRWMSNHGRKISEAAGSFAKLILGAILEQAKDGRKSKAGFRFSQLC
jgi:hypothetical protein